MSNPAPNVAITVPSKLTDEMKCEGVRSLRHNVNRPWEIAIEFAYEAMLAAFPQPSDERVLPDRSGIAIDAAYSARSLAQPKPECTDSDGEQT